MELSKSSKAFCVTCESLCCRSGKVLQLTLTEAQFLEKNGTRIKEVFSPSLTETDVELTVSRGRELPKRLYIKVFPDRGLYKLSTDCALLAGKDGVFFCSIYDDSRRPLVCTEFEAGGRTCLRMRQHIGLT